LDNVKSAAAAAAAYYFSKLVILLGYFGLSIFKVHAANQATAFL
jgi:hypothetical protein